MERHLRFAPEILARLGEELVPHPDQGVMELVRNAYDADAGWCRIEIADGTGSGGTLVVADGGDGMTEEQLASGFLLVGKSEKTTTTHTPRGRRKVGEKGLGRLAALRLGRRVEVSTRPAAHPGIAHVLRIDWTKFDAAEAVEDVPLVIETVPSTEPPGTTVTVIDLRQGFTPADAERLARALLLLTGPFSDKVGFRIECDAPRSEELV